MKKKSIVVISIIVAIIVLDQLLKFWVKTNMCLHEEKELIGSWFKLYFTENEGMAFGMVFFGGFWGKFILSLFRIAASAGIGWVIYKMLKKNISWGLVITTSLVFTGAVGNIIDCVFYGEIFSESVSCTCKNIPCIHVATFLPEAGGYAPILQGKVVDMLQLELFTINFPSWFPFWGNTSMEFFPAIFNIADSSITIGLFTMVLFYYKSLSNFVASFEPAKKNAVTNQSSEEII